MDRRDFLKISGDSHLMSNLAKAYTLDAPYKFLISSGYKTSNDNLRNYKKAYCIAGVSMRNSTVRMAHTRAPLKNGCWQIRKTE
ncbi:MAG TPA: hypothetical protein DET40_25475 [Lentisphaeria bacterium]|nr:MAG: hypothetical protein A2X45_18490 [Lentisphaerae bacterium GWF2_50_93]HCE46912.1 hypothetical protein [Lentisphaeria bacterium]